MNELKIFNNELFGSIAVLELEGKCYFPATKVATMLGYANQHDAILRHCQKDGVVKHEVIDNLGRTQLKSFINEGNLYRLITRSKLESAIKFESWVFDEVLPSIRRNGAYMTPITLENAIANPDFMIGLLENLKEEQRKTFELNQIIEEQQPKVLFANSVENSDDLILIGDLAKILKQNGYDTGQNRFFEELRKKGYLTKQNKPTQYSMNLGLFKIIERTMTTPKGKTKILITIKVTGKGQEYFINKFLKELDER